MTLDAPGRFAGWILLALCLPALAQDAEEKVRDVEYDADYAPAVRACEAAEKEAKDERYHRVERTYGAFARTLRLPVGVDGTKVQATFKNGVLTVTLPKTPAAKGTIIPIKAD